MAFTIKEIFKAEDLFMQKTLEDWLTAKFPPTDPPTKVTIGGTTQRVEEFVEQFLCHKRCSGIPCLQYNPPEWISEVLTRLKEDLNKELRTLTQIPGEELPPSVSRVDELEQE